MKKSISFGVVGCIVGTVAVAVSAEMITWSAQIPSPYSWGWGILSAYFLIVGFLCIAGGIYSIRE